METGYYGKNIYKLIYPSNVDSLLIDFSGGSTSYFHPVNNSRYFLTSKATPEGDSRNMWYVGVWEAGSAPWAGIYPEVQPSTAVEPTNPENTYALYIALDREALPNEVYCVAIQYGT